MSKRICFLATGSEIVSGEILNTNGQIMSQALFSKGASLGEHLVCDDEEQNLINAMKFLKPRCDALIITGGLGPTTDDRTRFALAKLLDLDLVFNEDSWIKIGIRAEKRGFTLTPNNKQQAYFPENATIFVNNNGSADACLIEHDNQAIFMLPGPPVECIPLFEEHMMPYFSENDYFTDIRQYKWHITGVGESQIAYKLEPIAEKHAVEIAYRCSKPDVYIKLHLNESHPIDEIIADFDVILDPYLIKKEFP